jgi:hypothetical protein
MILIRHYGVEDQGQVESLHLRQGLSYRLPPLEAPTMLVRTVVEENGQITHAALLRKTAEAYWLFDPRNRKRDKAGRLLMLHREMTIQAKKAGFEDVHCWVPPDVAKEFGKILSHLGWEKPLWTCYRYEVK